MVSGSRGGRMSWSRMSLWVIVTDSRAAASSVRVSMTAALCTTCRAVVQVPEDIKIQTMLSEAIKRIIKHHHKSLKEFVSRAQLMCGDLSLVHSLIQVFSYGFKSAPMRPSPMALARSGQSGALHNMT